MSDIDLTNKQKNFLREDENCKPEKGTIVFASLKTLGNFSE